MVTEKLIGISSLAPTKIKKIAIDTVFSKLF